MVFLLEIDMVVKARHWQRDKNLFQIMDLEAVPKSTIGCDWSIDQEQIKADYFCKVITGE